MPSALSTPSRDRTWSSRVMPAQPPSASKTSTASAYVRSLHRRRTAQPRLEASYRLVRGDQPGGTGAHEVGDRHPRVGRLLGLPADGEARRTDHGARGGVLETGEDAHQGGLADPARADQADPVAGRQGQVDALEERVEVEVLAQGHGT